MFYLLQTRLLFLFWSTGSCFVHTPCFFSLYIQCPCGFPVYIQNPCLLNLKAYFCVIFFILLFCMYKCRKWFVCTNPLWVFSVCTKPLLAKFKNLFLPYFFNFLKICYFCVYKLFFKLCVQSPYSVSVCVQCPCLLFI